MRYILKNDYITVEIDSHGAEIKSVKKNSDNTEFMWCGDAKFWGRTSPVLFPFVGAVKNKEYRHEGKTYSMGQHGFARDMEFTLVEKEDEKLLFELVNTDETLEKYPFAFKLKIGYELKKNAVKVLWKVENSGSADMYFSIGAHPAFMCPLTVNEACDGEKEDYSLLFETKDGDKKSKLDYYFINKDGQLVRKLYELKLADGEMKIKKDSFNESAYIFENSGINAVSLLNPNKEKYVTVSFDAPLLGIWSPEGKHAPFVCIEPWYGRCDEDNFTGELKEREYEIKLAVGNDFMAEYEIEYM